MSKIDLTRGLYTFEYERIFMKKIVKMMAVLALLMGFIGVASTQKDTVQVEAATVETKRVWFYPDYVTWWENDTTGETPTTAVGIHYWGGESVVGSRWAGTPMLKDAANDLWYYDVPLNTINVKFTRIKTADPTGEPWNKSIDTEIPANSGQHRFELWNDETSGEYHGAWVPYAPVTTTIVKSFSDTIDTSGEACNATAAQTAVNTYNSLSTFEQNQFNDLDVGEGVTGLQRLNYLISFYGIDTPIGSSVPGRIPSSDNSATATLIISALGVSSLAGYYFISKKKLFG